MPKPCAPAQIVQTEIQWPRNPIVPFDVPQNLLMQRITLPHMTYIQLVDDPFVYLWQDETQTLQIPILCLIYDYLNYFLPLTSLNKMFITWHEQTLCRVPSFPQISERQLTTEHGTWNNPSLMTLLRISWPQWCTHLPIKENSFSVWDACRSYGQGIMVKALAKQSQFPCCNILLE